MTALRGAIDHSGDEQSKTTMSQIIPRFTPLSRGVLLRSLADLHRRLKSCYRSMGGCWPLNPPPDLFVKTAPISMQATLLEKKTNTAPAKRCKYSLTYDLRPTQRAVKWRPDALWDHRHHVAVSKQNSSLHMTHKEFFDMPQAYDYKTKPRTPLEPSLIERTGKLLCS